MTAASRARGMELVVVGSGTVVPTPERVCAGYLLEHGDARVLLDCGPGVVHHLARFHLPWPRLTHVVLSHFHTDHIGDLPLLLFALKHGLRPARRDALEIVGPPGTGQLLRRMAAAFGAYMLDPGFPLRVVEAPGPDTANTGAGAAVTAPAPGAGEEPAPPETTRMTGDEELWSAPGRALPSGLRLRCARTPHTDSSVAWRIEGEAGSVGYTGDTGYADAVADFLGGVDLLVAECSLPESEAMETHLTPERLGRLAARARPGSVLATHVYPQLDGADLADLARAAGWSGPFRRAEDGLRLPVRGSARGTPAATDG